MLAAALAPAAEDGSPRLYGLGSGTFSAIEAAASLNRLVSCTNRGAACSSRDAIISAELASLSSPLPPFPPPSASPLLVLVREETVNDAEDVGEPVEPPAEVSDAADEGESDLVLDEACDDRRFPRCHRLERVERRRPRPPRSAAGESAPPAPVESRGSATTMARPNVPSGSDLGRPPLVELRRPRDPDRLVPRIQ